MKIELFDYGLPKNFIAQKPLKKRDESRLLVLDKKNGRIKHDIFLNLLSYLKKGDVLVINESRVRRCRLKGKKEKTGANIECFVLNKIGDNNYMVLLKPSKRLKPSDSVLLGEHHFTVKSKFGYGRAVVEFDLPVEEIFDRYGEVPLPPYIKNTGIREDSYQTVYAAKRGSSASPTAGLHFSKSLIRKLERKGIVFARLNLSIGIDTFRPISTENIEEHKMHSEYYSIDECEAEKIRHAKKSGNRIVAVGTTVVRVLETLMLRHKKIMGDSGSTGIYIYPGFKFRGVDWIITNFHLPKSTLLVMISAFAGRKNILKAYEMAKNKGYRFFSFGDCMLIK
ncbi:MAG: tRNA preQ1(34) S-adenosylmethionine ribosyltransferase-isomerase QueA [Actinomycetota bacterium]|nr:tRNA preQ1(34) S-adenosylmethionine ribosyltransferase-isomerase QueA [Actinomycetota bacterium]